MIALEQPGAIPDEKTNIHVRAKMSWQQVNLKTETKNMAENYTMLHERRDTGQVKCMSEMPSSKGPVLLCGSGSSFNKVIGDLKAFPGQVWCSTSQLSTLVKLGRPPDVVIAVDPNVNLTRNELAVEPGGLDKTAYLTHPSGPARYFQEWFNRTSSPVYLFRIMEPSYDFYSFHLPAVYPWLKVALLPFIDSGASMISLASRMGFDPIYLVGYDFGGLRFDIWEWNGKEWHFDPATGNIMDGPKGPGGLGANEVMLYAMRGSYITAFMAMFKRQNSARIFNLASETNMADIPKCTWEQAKSGDIPEWDSFYKEDIALALEKYLAKNDTFLVPIEGNMGCDFRVYMLKIGNFINALAGLNNEILQNKWHFYQLERQFNLSIAELIKRGMLTIDKGEMLLMSDEDIMRFDWRAMRPVDTWELLMRAMKLLE